MTRIATTLTVALVALAACADARKTVTRTRTVTSTTTLAQATTTVQNKYCARALITPLSVEPRDEEDDDVALAKRARAKTVYVTTTKTKTKAPRTKTVTAACAVRTPTLNNAYDTSQPQDLVAIHNALRAKHGANPVTWDQSLADFALSYASECNSGHSGHAGYGENLAWGAPPSYYTDQALFDLWANEANGYDYNSNSFSESAGHFTQAVWKGSTSIGCAVVSCPAKYMGFGQDYKSLTCEYYPQGNVQGNFVANVGRPQ